MFAVVELFVFVVALRSAGQHEQLLGELVDQRRREPSSSSPSSTGGHVSAVHVLRQQPDVVVLVPAAAAAAAADKLQPPSFRRRHDGHGQAAATVPAAVRQPVRRPDAIQRGGTAGAARKRIFTQHTQHTHAHPELPLSATEPDVVVRRQQQQRQRGVALHPIERRILVRKPYGHRIRRR